MTIPALSANGAEAAVHAYEELRRYALTGSPCGGSIGGVLLLREGVATWIERGAAGGASATPSTAGDRPAGAHVMAGAAISPQLHLDIIHVLVSMALSRREALSP